MNEVHSPIDGLYFQHYTAVEARHIRDEVESIFRDSYIEAIESGEEFETPEAFMQRFDAYTDPNRPPGFELIIAKQADEPIGQTWGWPLTSETQWWTGLQLDDGDPVAFATENGTRTFALSEIMVRTEFTGRGIAHALHDELLSGRPEQRATLLVRPDNERAYRTYIRWGWSRAGTLRPAWPDAPQFEVLMLDL